MGIKSARGREGEDVGYCMGEGDGEADCGGGMREAGIGLASTGTRSPCRKSCEGEGFGDGDGCDAGVDGVGAGAGAGVESECAPLGGGMRRIDKGDLV